MSATGDNKHVRQDSLHRLTGSELLTVESLGERADGFKSCVHAQPRIAFMLLFSLMCALQINDTSTLDLAPFQADILVGLFKKREIS